MSAPQLFDRDLIGRRLARADAGNFVVRMVLADLDDRLATLSRRFEAALVLVPHAAMAPAALASAGGPIPFAAAATPFPDEVPALPRGDYDLIVSLLDLQVVNDVPGYLSRLLRHLRPDGLFLAAFVGGNTLAELRQAFVVADSEASGGVFARIAPFIDVRDAGALLQRAGFALPVADVESHQVRYDSALALMAELKAMGASNPLADRPHLMATRSLLARASEAYADLAGDPDGRVRASLDIVWISGWAPAASQQQPLRPGSAKVDLRDILGRKG